MLNLTERHISHSIVNLYRENPTLSTVTEPHAKEWFQFHSLLVVSEHLKVLCGEQTAAPGMK